jgi:hypothetical protein
LINDDFGWNDGFPSQLVPVGRVDLRIDVCFSPLTFSIRYPPRYLLFPMKAIRLISAALFLSLLSSCGLIQSVLKVPTSILKTVDRSAGISQLTDEAPDPVATEAPETVEKLEGSEQ